MINEETNPSTHHYCNETTHYQGKDISILLANVSRQWPVANELTHEQLGTHVCVLSTVATNALVLKRQAISTPSAD